MNMKKVFLGNVKQIDRLSDSYRIVFHSLYGNDEIAVISDESTAELLRDNSSDIYQYQIYYEEGKESEGEISLLPYVSKTKKESECPLIVGEDESIPDISEMLESLLCEDEY